MDHSNNTTILTSENTGKNNLATRSNVTNITGHCRRISRAMTARLRRPRHGRPTPPPPDRTEPMIDTFKTLLGGAGVLTEPDDIAPYATDWKHTARGVPACVPRPRNTADVAAMKALP